MRDRYRNSDCNCDHDRHDRISEPPRHHPPGHPDYPMRHPGWTPGPPDTPGCKDCGHEHPEHPHRSHRRSW